MQIATIMISIANHGIAIKIGITVVVCRGCDDIMCTEIVEIDCENKIHRPYTHELRHLFITVLKAGTSRSDWCQHGQALWKDLTVVATGILMWSWRAQRSHFYKTINPLPGDSRHKYLSKAFPPALPHWE